MDDSSYSRRHVLRTAAISVSVALAGCSGDDGPGTTAADHTTVVVETTVSPPETTVETVLRYGRGGYGERAYGGSS